MTTTSYGSLFASTLAPGVGHEGNNTQFSYDEANRFTRDMNSVLRQINGWHSAPSSISAHTYGTDLAHLIVQRHVLYLHRPLLDKAAKDPLYCFSRKTSTEAATFIIERVSSGPLSELFERWRDFQEQCYTRFVGVGHRIAHRADR